MSISIISRLIDSELNWREKELAHAKLFLHKSLIEPKSFPFSYRCFIAMTCAHYEGFTKAVLCQVLDLIQRVGLTPSQLNGRIRLYAITPSARKKILAMSNTDLLNQVLDNGNPVDHFAIPLGDDAISKCGNLDFKNLKWAMGYTGIDFNKFLAYENNINKLVYLRHSCAHGELISLDRTKTNREIAHDAFMLQEKIIEFLHHMSVESIDYVNNGWYKCPS
jgi:hypothetical protein